MANVNEDEGTVTIVTLQRGKTYSHFYGGVYHEFKRAVGKEITDEGLVNELEAITEEVNTTDDDVIVKDVFRIERDKSRRSATPVVVRRRLRIVSEDVPEDNVRQAAPVRKPPTGFKPRPR